MASNDGHDGLVVKARIVKAQLMNHLFSYFGFMNLEKLLRANRRALVTGLCNGILTVVLAMLGGVLATAVGGKRAVWAVALACAGVASAALGTYLRLV